MNERGIERERGRERKKTELRKARREFRWVSRQMENKAKPSKQVSTPLPYGSFLIVVLVVAVVVHRERGLYRWGYGKNRIEKTITALRFETTAHLRTINSF